MICKLKICTFTDGAKNEIVRMGKMEDNVGELRLRYQEDEAEIQLTLAQNRAILSREGDYSLFLPLIEGEKTEGALGLGSARGPVPVDTHLLQYAYERGKLEANLRYDLLFGEEKQAMQLKITATTREEK